MPPLASDWANPDSEHIPGFEIIDDPIPGAVVSDGRHVGIVVSDGCTVSVIGRGPVDGNDWGFRPEQKGSVVWRAPINR